MRLQSTHTPKQYKEAMKQRMGSRFALWSERFTGIFIGRFFYVTHHAGYEWNRRITCQTNSAWGYIRKTDSGCEVRCHTAKSALCPHLLLLYILVLGLYTLCSGIDFGSLKNIPGVVVFMLICIYILIPIVYTVFESITDPSIEGEKSLLGLLYDPSDYFGYLNSRKKK